ncbi:MAG: PcfJ domain-containing protein [Gallionellaceae bacterium]|jgi:hypothetical protein|nr:PcfJ domain-containing protein [Gallionellaceae bacterium]
MSHSIEKKLQHRAANTAHRKLRAYKEQRYLIKPEEEPDNDWDINWIDYWLGDFYDEWDDWGYEDRLAYEKRNFIGSLVDILDDLPNYQNFTELLRWRQRHPAQIFLASASDEKTKNPREGVVIQWLEMLQENAAKPVELLLLNETERRAERALRHRFSWTTSPVLASDTSIDVLWERAWLTAVLTYPVWIRPLSTWAGTEPLSLLKHLLVEYEPPAHLWGWLFDDGRVPEHLTSAASPLPWLVCQAQGISLANISKKMGWGLPSSEIHACLSLGNDDLTMKTGDEDVESHWRPEFRRYDFSLIRITAAIKQIRPDIPLEGLHQFIGWADRRGIMVRDDFCLLTAKWFATHFDQFQNENDIHSVLNWALHLYGEGQNHRNLPFSWKGRTAHSALAAAREYERLIEAQRNRYLNLSWPAHGWDWTPETEDENTGWKIVELLTAKALGEEGAAQNHCVGGYALCCVEGRSAIVQVLHDDKRMATIEVHPRSKQLIQVRSKFNSRPTPETISIVKQWVKTFGLVWDGERY